MAKAHPHDFSRPIVYPSISNLQTRICGSIFKSMRINDKESIIVIFSIKERVLKNRNNLEAHDNL